MRIVPGRSSVGVRAVAAGLLLAGSPATAADFYGENWSYESPDKTIELRGGFGAIGIEAREYVYNLSGSEDVLSLLIWQSVAPMATIDIKANLPDEWTIKARARAAIAGDSYMEDYDWLLPHRPSFAFDDWTDRSQHPNTNLDWYLDGSIAVGKNLIVEPNATLNLNGGIKYTDVQWTAIGGSHVYSDLAFRDDVGTFADEPGITYRQQLPVLFAGLDVEATDGQWTYSADAQAGVVLFGLATDHHWMRDLRFLDIIHPTPVFAASATATYDFSDNLGVFLSGSVEKLMLARADTDTYDIPTGAKLGGTAPNVAGAELGTITLSAGLKGSF
jgi:outer membrane protease